MSVVANHWPLFTHHSSCDPVTTDPKGKALLFEQGNTPTPVTKSQIRAKWPTIDDRMKT